MGSGDGGVDLNPSRPWHSCSFPLDLSSSIPKWGVGGDNRSYLMGLPRALSEIIHAQHQ